MQTIGDIDHFRALFQAMPEPLIVLNEEMRVISFNEAATKLFAISAEELWDLKVFDEKFKPVRLDLTFFGKDLTPFEIVQKTGQPQLNKIIGIYRDDDLRWLSINAVPISEESKIPHQILVTFKDITEERLAREKLIYLQHELAERENFLDTILNALPILVSYVDKNLKYKYINSTYEKWFKIKKEDVVEKPVEHTLGQDILKIIKPNLEGVLKGEIQNFTAKVPHQEGGERTVNVYYIPDISSGGVQGYFAIINDITEVMTISQKIEKQEKELRQILEALPAHIGHWNKDLINIHANTAYSEFFRKNPEEVKEKHISELLGLDLYQKTLPYINRVLAGEVQTFESDLTAPDGSIKHLLATYLPDRNEGKVEGFFVIVTDVTPIKELLKKELVSRERAERATKLRDDMIAIVSHDLRNPLSIIQTSSELLLKNTALEINIRKSIERIRKTSKNMISMLTDLLDINKIEQGHFEVGGGIILQDTSNCINEFVENQKPLAKDKNIHLVVELEQNLPSLYFNAIQLQRVFQNLIGNALKFTPKDGRIWVRAKSSPEGVLFQIEDNGPGIEKDLLPILFDRFSQGRKFSNKGSGLGLAIARGIIEAHHGKIWVESNPGKGTTFSFIIPLSKPFSTEEFGEKTQPLH